MRNKSTSLLLLLFLNACGDASFSSGVTPGGNKDIKLARESVAAGVLPSVASLRVEGVFAEHDLPLEGEPCTDLFCVNGALGVAPHLPSPRTDTRRSLWLQLGLASGPIASTEERSPVALVMVVDVSGSMAWGGPEDDAETPGNTARALLHRLTAELGENDQVAIVTYGSSVRTPLPLTSGVAQGTIGRAIRDLSTGGSTDMESGLRVGFEVAALARTSIADTRVVLFTDARPNVGATEGSDFEVMVATAADAGVGTTVLGLGLDLGAEIVGAMSHVQGGNAFTLIRRNDVGLFMDEHWPYFTSPIAYDLELSVQSSNYEVREAYGFPTRDGEPSASLRVSTVFRSKNRGALLVELESASRLPDGSVDVALSYRDRAGTLHARTLNKTYAGEAREVGTYYEQSVVQKTVSLALMITGMREALTTYAAEPADGIAMMANVVERVESDATALQDPTLQAEVEFAQAVLQLMRQ